MTTESPVIKASGADLAASVQENMYALFRAIGRLPGNEHVEGEKLCRHISYLASPIFHGVWRVRLNRDELDGAIEATTQWFKARNSEAAFWWTGPGTTPPELGERLMAHGMLSTEAALPGTVTAAAGMPGMVADLDHMNHALLAQVPRGFVVDQVRDEAALLAFKNVAIEAYDAPERWADAWVQATTSVGFGSAPWRMYLGRLDGQPVACSMIFPGAGVAGVYIVGTVPSARGRGFGGAVTLKPLLETRDKGYRYAVLFSSEMGIHAYEGIGFRQCGVRINRYMWRNA